MRYMDCALQQSSALYLERRIAVLKTWLGDWRGGFGESGPMGRFCQESSFWLAGGMYLKSLRFSHGAKTFLICIKYKDAVATPKHLLDCIDLEKDKGGPLEGAYFGFRSFKREQTHGSGLIQTRGIRKEKR
ncbi:hypothetical protein TNCV_3862331 [Trichonephila clavipes]|nr:hypothetical protein TNCV_3862331 [Trichonephila clavipes]